MKTATVWLAAAACAGPAFGQGTDECIGATALTIDVPMAFDTTTATLSPETWPCAMGGGPDLWFQYTTTILGNDLLIETCGSSYDTAVEIFSGPCGALVSESCNDDNCGLQSGALVVNPPLGTTFYIRVGGYNGSLGAGTILASELHSPPTPDCSAPDGFEDNDECTVGVILADGTHTALNVEEFDHDFFQVRVRSGQTLTVDALFQNDFGDVDLYLWDPHMACGTDVVGSGAGAIAASTSTTDHEQIVYTNSGATTETLIIEVDMWTLNGCNEYDLVIDGAVFPSGIGTPYCQANPNSTGQPSAIFAIGSPQVADRDVTLRVENLPPNTFGFFIVSPHQAFIPHPAGSAGVLCIAGPVGRFVGPGQVQDSGAAGEISLAILLDMIPSPTGFLSTSPGDTWNFQLWHRDAVMGAATSNFSNARSIAFL